MQFQYFIHPLEYSNQNILGFAISWRFFSFFFLLMLAIIDEYYGNTYLMEHLKVKQSFTCQLLGTTMNFSILLSTLSMLLITIERFQVITDPFKTGWFFKYPRSISIFTCLISFMYSIIPFFLNKVNLMK